MAVRTIPYKVVDENGFRTSVALLFFVPGRLSWDVLKPMDSGHSSNIWILNRDISKDWTQELQFWTGISPGPQNGNITRTSMLWGFNVSLHWGNNLLDLIFDWAQREREVFGPCGVVICPPVLMSRTPSSESNSSQRRHMHSYESSSISDIIVANHCVKTFWDT